MDKQPNHLQYVAWAFMFIGALALVQTVQMFMTSPAPVPNFLMVFLAVGWGLLKRKPLWRTFALSCAYVMLVFYLGNVAMLLFGNQSMPAMAWWEMGLFWAIRVLAIAASGYAIWALQTQAVREQFDSKL